MTAAQDLSERALALVERAAHELAPAVAAAAAHDLVEAQTALIRDDPARDRGEPASPETCYRIAAMEVLVAAARQAESDLPGDDDPEDRVRATGWEAVRAGDASRAEAAGRALLDYTVAWD